MNFSRRRVGAVLALVLVLSALLVPAASAAPTAGGPIAYWVRPGDTLYGIANRFGVSAWAIADANNIRNWNKIYAGQRLWIPQGGYKYPGPCGWNPCPAPKPPPPPPPPPPGPCGYSPCPPQPGPGPCTGYGCQPQPEPGPAPCTGYGCQPQPGPAPCNGYGCQPGPGPCGYHGCLPPLLSNWQGNFYNNSTNLSGNVTTQQNYPALDFNWNGGSPANGVNGTNWSARFTTTIYLQDGQYRTQVAVDDGARVWIDGTQVINGWNTQPVTVYSQDVWVGAGNHTITVEYYQAYGLSELHFAMVRR